MNWVKEHKLPVIKAIQHNGQPYIKLGDLWQALYLPFNSAQDHQIDPYLLEEVPDKEITKWVLFLKEELLSAIEKYRNTLTLELDKLFWKHFKRIVKNDA